MHDQIVQKILEKKLIAIIRGIDSEKCLKVAQAIYDGGIEFIEVTFNQNDTNSFHTTATTISLLNKHFNGKIFIGAGTVLTIEQCNLAAAAGAQYIISPDTNVAVIQATRKKNLVSIPGVFTPTEMMTAHHAGADFLKIFPAGNLNSNYVKAVLAPLSHLKFLAVGGINEQNMSDFLAAGCKGFGIGGNLVNEKLIQSNNYSKITEIAKNLCDLVK